MPWRHSRRTPPASIDQAAVSRWFRRNARDLPWRRPAVRCAYAALVSETMAQQTQIGRVVEAFEAFMLRFPTPAALAAASEQEVLAAWRGLGYYRRALHLHAAAKVIVQRFAGEVPRDPADLRSLPGVGRYTAGAVASIAFRQAAPIVDGNVARVLLRVHGRRSAVNEPATVRWLWQEAERLVSGAQDPASFNEGLMELGAVVCTPRNPRCETCPVRGTCVARREGSVLAIPVPKKLARRLTVHHHAVVVRRGRLGQLGKLGRLIMVEQRPETGLWARMWQVPTVEDEHLLDRAAIVERLPVKVDKLDPLGTFVHVTTHRTVRVHVFAANTKSRRGRWVHDDEVETLPMSAAALRALRMGRR